MVINLMTAVGREEREKQHRWAEALSGVQVLQATLVPVKLTLMFPFFQMKRKG